MFIDVKWLNTMIELINEGMINKAEKDNITIYKCGKLIRIDIKEV